ncbi:MAG: hypothetical protein IJ226_01875 [Clostridia bacterium]|nr:hypothetical protein [Clostridia bacterium]
MLSHFVCPTVYAIVHWVGHPKHPPDIGVAKGIRLVRFGCGQFTGLSATRRASSSINPARV